MDNPNGYLAARHCGEMSLRHLVGPGALLGSSFPLPLDRPFTWNQALATGLSERDLAVLSRTGLLRHPLRGVYVAAQASDNMTQRVRAVSLVLPEGSVVTDRTAAYLHGVEILPRTSLTTPPAISVFRPEGTRLRREGVDSGSRMLLRRDVCDIGGLMVTTPLRTACDLGRLLWRYDALAAIDLFLRCGVPKEALLAEADSSRFRGFRWIRQLRTLAPLGDARSESPGESALRLHWIDAGLPDPEPQWWVENDLGVPIFRLDLTAPELRYAAEYDGAEFHDDEQRAHDGARRNWMRDQRGWVIDVFRKESVYAMRPDPRDLLLQGVINARTNLSRWTL